MAQGLPRQGARAVYKSWTDSNQEMVKNANKKKAATKKTTKKGK